MRDTGENRKGLDRRARENGPPNGWSERRRTVERRRPEVREIAFSEWLFHLRRQSEKEMA